MNIALIDGATILRVGDHRTLFPQTSFPASGPSDAFMAEHNALPVDNATTCGPTERIASCEPYIDGAVVRTVEAVPIPIPEQWATVRAQRNQLLRASDWTQLSDATADKAAWATYRQALRDVPAQADPFAIQWPVAPVD